MKKAGFVVGIGASAGGLDALKAFFDSMPGHTGMAFIIVQHLSPNFKSLMDELLGKHTQMKIVTAENDMEIEADHIYLNTRDKQLACSGSRLVLLDKDPSKKLNLPIDLFFHSLGSEFKEKAIAIILSGTGTDGSRGIKTIKEQGGTIMVQYPESAQFDGMPKAAIDTKFAEYILPPAELAKKVIQINFTASQVETEQIVEKEIDTFRDILDEIYKHTLIDFKKYKQNMLARRLAKRMELNNFASIKDYYIYLSDHSSEKELLAKDFLIGVTNFFRDTEAFELLKKNAFPILFRDKSNMPLRIWTPACSTGEEAYSIAITLEEYISETGSDIDYKIFATDIDYQAIERASKGIYNTNALSEVSHDILNKYFFKQNDNYHVAKFLREKIVFSRHNLIKDPALIRMDLISCRNFLIYLKQEMQKKVLSSFHYSLNKNGILFLGSSETLGDLQENFDTIDSKWRIYQNISSSKGFISSGSYVEHGEKESEFIPLSNSLMSKTSDYNENFFNSFLAEKFSPACIFIDSNYNILFSTTDLFRYVHLPIGRFSENILKMVNQKFAALLRNGIRRASEDNKKIVFEGFILETKEGIFELTVKFTPLDKPLHLKKIYLIELIENKTSEKEKAEYKSFEPDRMTKQHIEDLENELKTSRTEMQNLIEELETSNEELQSSNEELIASNEELQSTNEELQSVNEELYSVNSELQLKNKELEELNDDMNNLLESTDIAVLFVDTNLNIRKFTPALKRIFNLNSSDIGRPIENFAANFVNITTREMIIDIRKVMSSLQMMRLEVETEDGSIFYQNLRPFITQTKKIGGVISTFIDITEVKNQEKKMKLANERLEAAMFTSDLAWWEMDAQTGRVIFNPNKVTMLGYSLKEFENAHYTHFTNLLHPEDYEKAMQAMRDHLEGKRATYEIEYRIKCKSGDYFWFYDRGSIVERDREGKPLRLTGIVLNITDRKKTEEALFKAKEKAEHSNLYKTNFLANICHEIRTPLSGIIGFSELLKESLLSEKERISYLDTINSSSLDLLKLTEDLVDLSRLETGMINISEEDINLILTLKELKLLFEREKVARKKTNVDIKLSIPEGSEPFFIKADQLRLKQVFINLLFNAFKFTRDGFIEFGFLLKDNNIEFFVRDTGTGISKEKQEQIFKRFEQADKSISTVYGGMGLGLSITKDIVEIQNGKIWVNSEAGHGSTFYFTLPYKKGENVAEPIRPESGQFDFKGKTIILVEDDEINAHYVQEVLKKAHGVIYHSANINGALDLFKNHPETSAIITDMHIENSTGYDLLARVREINKNIIVIAHTASIIDQDVKKYLRDGFTDLIIKPATPNLILTTLGKYI